MEDLALTGLFSDVHNGQIGGGTLIMFSVAALVVLMLFMTPRGSAAGRSGGMKIGWVLTVGGGAVLIYLLYLAVRQ